MKETIEMKEMKDLRSPAPPKKCKTQMKWKKWKIWGSPYTQRNERNNRNERNERFEVPHTPKEMKETIEMKEMKDLSSVWKSSLLPFLVYFWARTLPSKFPIIIEVLEHKILGLVRLISGLLTGNFSFLGTPVSMKKINGNVPAAKLPKKAKDRTFKH